ncbi:hypothetical protein [Sphingomicrobium sediminis]|uniref:Uncharacterized protein n=1 Tax=Sphingomicrobium sediminis TaxID=2950949 RepID=A0A9X2EFQ6_9SPHN|nr:hypothetical protein [Sphingomicrobium sediminis]MCM8557158.1 hypothetical protein [Sphingomicrobium sediminis]
MMNNMKLMAGGLAAATLSAGVAIAHGSGLDHHKDKMIESALSAGPASVTDGATVLDGEGNVLREGSNGWTCLPEGAMGAMCNDATWMAALGAMMSGEPFPTGSFGVSYMLAGEGDTPGVSNLDPMASEPTEDNMWIKDGPHMMIILPDPAMYADMTNDTSAPVYVMWKDTPYAHLMVRIEEADYE